MYRCRRDWGRHLTIHYNDVVIATVTHALSNSCLHHIMRTMMLVDDGDYDGGDDNDDIDTDIRRGSRIVCGGGGQRRPCTAGAFGALADGGSRVDKHQIKVHSVHRIFRAIFFVCFFAIVKKFVEKKNWWSRAGWGHDPPPPGSAPGYRPSQTLYLGVYNLNFNVQLNYTGDNIQLIQ